MPKLSVPPLAREHVLAALEACCGALRSLELAAALTPDEDDERHRQIEHAIESLRKTISALRARDTTRESGVGAGFVVGTGRDGESAAR